MGGEGQGRAAGLGADGVVAMIVRMIGGGEGQPADALADPCQTWNAGSIQKALNIPAAIVSSCAPSSPAGPA